MAAILNPMRTIGAAYMEMAKISASIKAPSKFESLD